MRKSKTAIGVPEAQVDHVGGAPDPEMFPVGFFTGARGVPSGKLTVRP